MADVSGNRARPLSPWVLLYGLLFIALGTLAVVAIWKVPHRLPLQARLMPSLIGGAFWITTGVAIILRRVTIAKVLVWVSVLILALLAALALFSPSRSLLLVQTTILLLAGLLAFWYTRYASR